MKISNYMNNTNSIMEKNTDKVQKGNSQTNEKHTVGQSVKLSISNEGLEYYRNRIQQSGHNSPKKQIHNAYWSGQTSSWNDLNINSLNCFSTSFFSSGLRFS